MADTAATVTIGCNIQYLTTPPGILKLLQAILGLISWACVASVYSHFDIHASLQFAMFLAITPWICTIWCYVSSPIIAFYNPSILSNLPYFQQWCPFVFAAVEDTTDQSKFLKVFLIIFMAGLNATTCSGVPWGVVETLYNGIVTLLYFVAACIISVFGKIPTVGAGAAFAFFTTIAYLIHFAFSFKEWRGLWPWQGCGTAAPTTTNT